jgi:lysozyme family protein
MANYKLIIPHVKKNEGGLADTLKDTNPAKNPSPIKNPKTGLYYHTNKGIIWGTWVAWSKKKGIAADAQRWYRMSDADWEDVMKTLYWDSVFGDKINSQAIAEILFEAVWGGSAKSLIVYLQTYLRNAGYNVAVDGAMGKETYTALNDFTKNDKKHAQLIKDLTAKRLATLQTLSSWSWAGKAWTRRLFEIRDAGLKYITENPVKTGGAAVGLLLLGAGAYFLSKGGFTKIVG